MKIQPQPTIFTQLVSVIITILVILFVFPVSLVLITIRLLYLFLKEYLAWVLLLIAIVYYYSL